MSCRLRWTDVFYWNFVTLLFSAAFATAAVGSGGGGGGIVPELPSVPIRRPPVCCFRLCQPSFRICLLVVLFVCRFIHDVAHWVMAMVVVFYGLMSKNKIQFHIQSPAFSYLFSRIFSPTKVLGISCFCFRSRLVPSALFSFGTFLSSTHFL